MQGVRSGSPSSLTVAWLRATLLRGGEVTLRLEGELMLGGVTRPTVWDVTLRAEGKEFTGRAATQFNFATFGLAIPRVASVLSIVDEIRLEYDLRLVVAPVP